ncbi:MAG: DUF5132 domain-containing protein [Oscillatoria sp. PMC 1051.18]|uniref:DUF5132 domain-containing protein n=1 Tax=Oscillatoria salina TaxID=331517 RepID=UPI0013B9BB62|nr:DUF5132 domain-containing protein [Oscillatoria salina]MBZ8179464.1 DUF5132 domain-containing protein [Oscillatoria salina IIICB1]MEC4894721.1 DUF5132 domain-containing protein [Oscillatoria sp. PMC 1050.18]MEC5031432.1 DUF5132 domain-containing protein [Oscillatoria sp. PMC 1051.18]NET89095.1 DUF5132 domain-containing protein [Kamptonema sp. SIO1D9]
MGLKVEDLFEDLGAPGIAAGIGAVVLAPFVIPALKPVTKAVIKGGIVVYEKGKGIIAEGSEAFEDMVAEAKAELAEKRSQKAIEAAQGNSEMG